MGIVWEAYHKGVPLLGVPENPTDKCIPNINLKDIRLYKSSFLQRPTLKILNGQIHLSPPALVTGIRTFPIEVSPACVSLNSARNRNTKKKQPTTSSNKKTTTTTTSSTTSSTTTTLSTSQKRNKNQFATGNILKHTRFAIYKLVIILQVSRQVPGSWLPVPRTNLASWEAYRSMTFSPMRKEMKGLHVE